MFLVMLTLILGLGGQVILNHLSGWASSLILKRKVCSKTSSNSKKLWKEHSFIPAALWKGKQILLKGIQQADYFGTGTKNVQLRIFLSHVYCPLSKQGWGHLEELGAY